MKRFFFAIAILFFVNYALVAQIQVTGGTAYSLPNPSGVDYVFIFAGVADAEISYTGSAAESSVRWTKYDGTVVASGTVYMSPEDATGYILKAGSDSITFWTIDYSQHLPQFTDFYVQENVPSPCMENILTLEGYAPNFEYSAPNALQQRVIYREFTIEWETLAWSDEAWNSVTQTSVLQGLTSPITVPAPYINTTYKVSGDQFATALGLTPVELTTTEYTAVAICDTVITITETRSALNETDRPAESTAISGSAPLDIQFSARANEPVAQYYQWQIMKDDVLLVQRSDREHRYTFDDYGVYKVKLSITNQAGCSDSTEVVVTVVESMLQVPNVFTPNGDGKNDEFRVAYKSLVEFHAWVYNRWGRLVYSWTDPAKGWDGKVNGKNASPGAYFYIIQAKGADGVVYKTKGDINLIGR